MVLEGDFIFFGGGDCFFCALVFAFLTKLDSMSLNKKGEINLSK